MIEGFEPYPEWRRTPGSELNVQVDVEFYVRPAWDNGMTVVHESTGRRRITIEGTSERMAPYLAAIEPLLQAERDA